MNAEIPFKFTAGDKELPPGNCSFDISKATQVSIRCPRASAVVQAMSLKFTGDVFKDPPRHEMLFNRYDGDYFLSQVWIGHQGMELAKSDAERDLADRGVEGRTITLKVKK